MSSPCAFEHVLAYCALSSLHDGLCSATRPANRLLGSAAEMALLPSQLPVRADPHAAHSKNPESAQGLQPTLERMLWLQQLF